MPVYRVQAPNGRVLEVEGPAGATDEQLTAVAAEHFAGTRQRAADQVANDSITKGAKNFAKDMSGTDLFLSGAGKALNDIWRGGKQLVGIDNQGEIDEAKKRDAPLTGTGAGLAGNIVGGAGVALPSLLIPGVNTYTGAALAGAGMGLLSPVATGESRMENAAIGAGAGILGQGVGNAIGRAIRPVQSTLPPETAALAQNAQARGIPLTAGAATGSRPLQVAESVLENLPFTSGPQLALRQGQQQAYNRAVGGTFGSAENALTPEVLGGARSRIGQQFTDLAGRNTLTADNALMTQLAHVDEAARRYLTPDVGRVVINRLDDVMARIENGQMTGVAYRNLDSELGRAVRGTSNGDLRHSLGDLRGALREAMDRSISQADQQAWQGARRQYANLMTVAPIAARSETGDISGRTLLSAVNTSNRNARFGGPSDLADIGRIGRAFVADPIPNSGTAQRQFMQSLLTGGGGAGVGAGVSMATGNDPLKGAAIGAGITGAGLLTPRVAQSLMNSGLGQAYLRRGLLDLTPAQRAAISATVRTGAIGSAPALQR